MSIDISLYSIQYFNCARKKMGKVYFPQISEASVRFKRLKYGIEKGMGDNESELNL